MTEPNTSLREELDLALSLCERADAIAVEAFERGVGFESKADGTPVTEADRAIERMIREELASRFPEDAIIGEEFGGVEAAGGGREWIVDPIDGTLNFSSGIPLWSTLLGLRVDGSYVLGVVSVPGVGDRYWAARGEGAFHNGSAITVSDVASVGDSMVLVGDLEPLLASSRREPFLALIEAGRRSRGFGDSWGYGLLASGRAEILVEPWVAIWDVAGPAAVVEIAGGRITQFDGSPLAHGGSVLATNGRVHDACIEALAVPEGASA